MDEVLYFSRFVKRFERGDLVCYLNALRLRPVYINKELVEPLDRYFYQDYGTEIQIEELLALANSSELIPILKEEKILSPSLTIDSVISNIRKQYPAPYLSVMYLMFSEVCNLNCSYCFVNHNFHDAKKAPGGKMSLDTAKKALEFFIRGINLDPSRREEEKSIIFYGGEPLTNKECLAPLLEYIQTLKEQGRFPTNVKLSMVTNGTLMTKELARLLKKHEVAFGISLDGGTQELNSNRVFLDGSPAFPAIIKTVGMLKNEGVDFGLSITVSEEMLYKEDAIIASLMELGIKSIAFNPIMPSKDYIVSDSYPEKVADFIIKAYEALSPLGFSEDRISRKIDFFSKADIYYWDCAAAGGRQIVVAANGDIGICHGLIGERDDFFTNVNDTSFDHHTDDVFLKWNKFSPLLNEECQDCEALGICGGGCPLRAYQQTGKWGASDKQFCPHAKKTLEFLIWKLWNKLGEKSPPN